VPAGISVSWLVIQMSPFAITQMKMGHIRNSLSARRCVCGRLVRRRSRPDRSDSERPLRPAPFSCSARTMYAACSESDRSQRHRYRNRPLRPYRRRNAQRIPTAIPPDSRNRCRTSCATSRERGFSRGRARPAFPFQLSKYSVCLSRSNDRPRNLSARTPTKPS
jgi:hypothetical protein